MFQSEDSFAEQKKDYEEKIKSLESIVRMIDLKSKNTSDHGKKERKKERKRNVYFVVCCFSTLSKMNSEIQLLRL